MRYYKTLGSKFSAVNVSITFCGLQMFTYLYSPLFFIAFNLFLYLASH